MALTNNITRYVCDRCGESAYLQAGDPHLGEWHDITRTTADNTSQSALLCSDCYSTWRNIATRHDSDYTRFMLGASSDSGGTKPGSASDDTKDGD